MPKPLTRRQLDTLPCTKQHGHTSACADGPKHIEAACHPGGAVNCAYDRRTGALALTCAFCDKEIVEILVAPSSPPPPPPRRRR